jgi:hypothetical protein
LRTKNLPLVLTAQSSIKVEAIAGEPTNQSLVSKKNKKRNCIYLT